jgi:hypothetical protein
MLRERAGSVRLLDFAPVLLVLAAVLQGREEGPLQLLRLLEARPARLVQARKGCLHLQGACHDRIVLSMEWAALVRAALILLLGTAALAKSARIEAFQTALIDHELVPRRFTRPLARITIGVEAALAVALAAGIALPVALALSSVLLIAFTAVATRALMRGATADCGCLGGAVKVELGWPSIVGNVALAVAAFASIAAPSAGIPLPTGSPQSSQLTVAAWCGGSVVVILYWLVAYARTVLSKVASHIAEAG